MKIAFINDSSKKTFNIIDEQIDSLYILNNICYPNNTNNNVSNNNNDNNNNNNNSSNKIRKNEN